MFYLIEITEYNDGTKTEVGVYSYETANAAVSKFHTKMGGAMARENVEGELLEVIASNGNIVVLEKYNKEKPIPETRTARTDGELNKTIVVY